MSNVLTNYASLDPRSAQAMLAGKGDAREIKIGYFANLLSHIKGRPVSYVAAARLLTKISHHRLIVKMSEAARISYRHPVLGNVVLFAILTGFVAKLFS